VTHNQHMRLALLLIAIFCLFAFSNCDDAAEPVDDAKPQETDTSETEAVEEAVPIPTDAEIKKMRVKQLKQFIAERGAKCAGCAEKSHLVAKAIEVKNDPLVAKEEPEKPKTMEMDDEKLQEILEALKKQNKEKKSMREQLRNAGINIGEEKDQVDIEDIINKMENNKAAEKDVEGKEEEDGESVEL